MILDEIIARRMETLQADRRLQPDAVLRRRAEECQRQPLDLAAALRADGFAVIAEVKRRSPSAGRLRPELDVASLCAAYVRGGAAAVSVLAEPCYFGGSFDDIATARTSLAGEAAKPILCKDFVISEHQVYRARLAGADAVLLIAACLDSGRLAALMAAVAALGMAPLVEVHDADELDAVLPLQPPVIGINNRDLRTFRTDLATTIALAPRVPPGTTVISESGIRAAADVRTVAAAGAHAALVGEALVRSADPAAVLRELRALSS